MKNNTKQNTNNFDEGRKSFLRVTRNIFIITIIKLEIDKGAAIKTTIGKEPIERML
jgi:hypothetical protein